MGRGKIEIKKIENKTNRQVTFSKRRNGILKKAHELTVLCDATVSLMMVSSTNRLHEYISPGAELKSIYDEYQKQKGTDIWSAHYEKMKKIEQKLLHDNSMLRRDINQRMGGDLEDLNIHELRGLEQEMEKAMQVIRNHKLHKIKTQTGTTRKKVKSLQEAHGSLLMDLEAKFGAPQFSLSEVDQGDYEAAAAYANEGAAANLFHPILHHHGGSYGSVGSSVHDLRLA